MTYNEYQEAIKSIDNSYRKNKVVFEDYITYQGCREPTLQEKETLVNCNESWLKDNGFIWLAEGTTNKVWTNGEFVVKVCKGRLKHDCYFELKYTSHKVGFSTIKSDQDYLLSLRRTFLNHILYPTIISKDYTCCIQDYLEYNDEKIISYFGDILIDLGPFENIAWSDRDDKAYIIDMW
jgi:hypothetical protein